MDKRKEKIAIAGGDKKSDYHEFFKDFNHPVTLSYYNDFYYFQYKGDVVYYHDPHVGLSYCMDIPEDYTVFETVNEANDYLKQLDMEEKANKEQIEEIIKHYYGIYKSNIANFNHYYKSTDYDEWKVVQEYVNSYNSDIGLEFLSKEFKKLEAEVKPIPRRVLVSDDEVIYFENTLIYDAGEDNEYRYFVLDTDVSASYGYKYMKEIPEVKKMTVPQIEEKLGYKIEVVE